MEKLANISVFESLQDSAHDRMSSMSVFNEDGDQYPGAFFSVDDGFVSVHNDTTSLSDNKTSTGGTNTGNGSTKTEIDAHTMLRNYAWMMQWANFLKGQTQNKRAQSRLASLYSLCQEVIDPQKYKKPYASYLKSFVDTLATYDPRYGAAFDIDALIQKYRPNAAAMKFVFNPAKEKQASLLKAAKQGLKDARQGNNQQAQGQQAQAQQPQTQPIKQTQPQRQTQAQPQQQSWFKRAGQAVKRGAKAVGRGIKDAWESGDQYAY